MRFSGPIFWSSALVCWLISSSRARDLGRIATASSYREEQSAVRCVHCDGGGTSACTSAATCSYAFIPFSFCTFLKTES